jgi:hypothetical protein
MPHLNHAPVSLVPSDGLRKTCGTQTVTCKMLFGYPPNVQNHINSKLAGINYAQASPANELICGIIIDSHGQLRDKFMGQCSFLFSFSQIK